VAELAGLPATVTKRAKSLLREIESKRVQASSQLSLLDHVDDTHGVANHAPIEPVIPESVKSLMDELQKYPLLQSSPLEVMSQVAKWKEIAENTSLQ
jgi:DNA mismatch repair protein MutS